MAADPYPFYHYTYDVKGNKRDGQYHHQADLERLAKEEQQRAIRLYQTKQITKTQMKQMLKDAHGKCVEAQSIHNKPREKQKVLTCYSARCNYKFRDTMIHQKGKPSIVTKTAKQSLIEHCKTKHHINEQTGFKDDKAVLAEIHRRRRQSTYDR